MVAALEGGYVQSILGQCVTSVVEAMRETTQDDDDDDDATATASASFDSTTCLSDIDPTATKNIQATMAAHKPYWKFLQPTADE
jgi:hypothetical protein